MTVKDIQDILEEWAPRWAILEKDNVGLQLGDALKQVRSVLICLDLTEEVANEAVSKKVDLVVSHHPLLYRPLRHITSSDARGRIILALASRGIAVYSAHTNLDAAADGVSFALARRIGLKNISFLSPLTSTMAKIAVFVPDSHVQPVMQAMERAGAGRIGDYTSCSFQTPGTGTFRGSSETRPFVGSSGTLEHVPETKLEMLAPRALIPSIVRAIEESHPYEEVALDVYPVENPNPNFGVGAIGTFPRSVSPGRFLALIRSRLGARAVRSSASHKRKAIRRVAVCGGSGSDLLDEAVSSGADAFVTADIRYHRFQDAANRILLVDAGHYETEHVILQPVAERIRRFARLKKQSLRVYVTKLNTNPIAHIS